MKRHGVTRTLKDILLWAVIILSTAWVVFPFYWAIITSFKEPTVILTRPSLIPFLQFKPSLVNWQMEFTNRWPEISGALVNSTVISLGATLIAIALGTLAGYGLARFRFYKWQNKDIAM